VTPLLLLALAAPSPPPARLALAPCDVPGLERKARCGTYEVFEDRRAGQGRRIGLKVVVVPASVAERLPDPLVFVTGGPGESATQAAAFLSRELRPLLERRDLLLLDQRGTGGSHPLNCTLYDRSGDLQDALGDFFPVEAVERCRAELETKADLGLYTTDLAADDLEEVRQALGYGPLNLYGGSYGTRAILVFMRRHPGSVRTATLEGVDPPNFPMPLYFARDAQRALDGVLGECAAEPACREAFPDIAAEARQVFERLARAPVNASVVHPESGEPRTVSLSRDLAAEAVRYLLYQPGGASQLPAVLHAAAQGDFAPLAEFALFGRRVIVSSGALGLYLSITCAEDLPRVGEPDAMAASRGSFLGDYRYRQQSRACGLWPRGRVSPGFAEPVASRAPTLLLSGEWDPVTPPSQAQDALKHLPNGRHVLIPHGAHGSNGMIGAGCITGLIAAFVERGSAQDLDASCLGQVRRPAFATSLPPLKPVAVAHAELAKLGGTYVAEGGGLQVTLTPEAGKLRATLPDESFLLVPVTAARFRVVGSLSTFLTFELDGERVRRVALEEAGVTTLNLTPAAGR
jgi:pimeloyl-ACP methyl ester carboxylesterase